MFLKLLNKAIKKPKVLVLLAGLIILALWVAFCRKRFFSEDTIIKKVLYRKIDLFKKQYMTRSFINLLLWNTAFQGYFPRGIIKLESLICNFKKRLKIMTVWQSGEKDLTKPGAECRIPFQIANCNFLINIHVNKDRKL